MSRSSVLERRPIIIAIAGPNGAGKSSFFHAHLSDLGLPFVNADVLARTVNLNAYEAAAFAGAIRRRLVSTRESFIFETVFSDRVGDKLEFLKEAEQGGYTVLLLFIGLASYSLSDQRVSIRVSQGGHDVPAAKLKARFPRTLKNLKRALAELSNVHVYDNSDLLCPFRLICTKEGGEKVVFHQARPKWLNRLLPA